MIKNISTRTELMNFTQQELTDLENFTEITDQCLNSIKIKITTILRSLNQDIGYISINGGPKPGLFNYKKDNVRIEISDNVGIQDRSYVMYLLLDGSVSVVDLYEPIDRVAIEYACELQEFPIVIDDVKIGYDIESLKIEESEKNLKNIPNPKPKIGPQEIISMLHFYIENCDENSQKENSYCHDLYITKDNENSADVIDVINLFTCPNKSHEPLYGYDPICYKNEKYIRLENFDRGDFKAILVNKYAWGMNINVAYVDIKKHKIYCWERYNYDYPTGISLKMNEKRSNALLFLDTDNVKKTYIYINKNKDLPELLDLCDNDRKNGWISLDIKEQFSDLFKAIEFHRNVNSNIKIYDYCNGDDWQKLSDMGGNQEENIRISKKILEQDYDLLKHLPCFLSDTCENIVKYNLMCSYSLSNNIIDAKRIFHQIKNEWVEWDHLASDPDLDVLRKDSEIQSFISENCTAGTAGTTESSSD